MMPPPTAANMPSFSPVRAMAGVPRQVATNSAVAMGIWLVSACNVSCCCSCLLYTVVGTVDDLGGSGGTLIF